MQSFFKHVLSLCLYVSDFLTLSYVKSYRTSPQIAGKLETFTLLARGRLWNFYQTWLYKSCV